MGEIARRDERCGRHSAHFRPVESHGVSSSLRRSLPEQPYQLELRSTTRNGVLRRFVPVGARGPPGVLSCGKCAARGGPMQVSEILKVKGNALFTIAPDGKLTEAVSIMAQHNMGSLVVIDKGRMVGMLTFKEVVAALDQRRGAIDGAIESSRV